jgi:leucyl aminopeptidase
LKIEHSSEALNRQSAPALSVFTFESGPGGSAARLPKETQALIEEARSSGEFTGKTYECLLLHRPPGLAASKLLVVGAGKADKFNSAVLLRLAGTAVRYLRARGVKEFAWALDEKDTPDSVQALAEGAVLADYDSDCYRADRKAERRIDKLVLCGGAAQISATFTQAADHGRIIGEAVNFTRDLVNEPSNKMPPRELARQAQEMAAKFGLECHVLGKDEILKKKMGALWAVAQGSEEEPRVIVLRYNPPQAPATPVIGLIGKGVTFDTGGISIKPAENMHEMKTDMAGGATMIGVMQAIAQLKPNVRVTAVIPSAENMPSGKSYRPGDVITAMSGKTIEVLNTDAEGRLLLADALAYARELGCTVLIDAATLTAAVTIALGNIITGVFGWNQEWVDRVLSSAKAVGEKMWQLPVDDDFRELYKSNIADIANVGGRFGGAITAAMFVGDFAGDTPWVHLDIAGTRWANDEKPYLAKGPTGVPVRTLTHLVRKLAQAKV